MDFEESPYETRNRRNSLHESMQIGRAVTTSTTPGSVPDELFLETVPIPPAPPHLSTRNIHQPSLYSSNRSFSDSRTLLPSQSGKNMYQYSSTTRFIFDEPVAEERRFVERVKSALLGNGSREPGWSGVPQTLTRGLADGFGDLMVDVLGVVATVPFFALGGVLAYQEGEEVEGSKRNVLEQCIMGAATLFPFVFSVIVGRTTIKLANWRLEKGASLGLLERLVGSRTVGGTIVTQFRLRTISIVGFGLTLVWLLSPLGSQSVLRILSTKTNNSAVSADPPVPISYLNSRQTSQASTLALNSWFTSFAGMFTSAILTPDAAKNSTMDTWGNVRVPFFSGLSSTTPDTSGWKQIDSSNTLVYSSLFGIPVVGLPLGKSTFSIESAYIELACSLITSTLVRSAVNFADPGLISPTGPFVSSQTISSSTTWAMGYTGDDITSLLPNAAVQSLDTLPLDATLKTYSSGLLLYQDFTGASNVTSIYCVPSQVYVESVVTCNRSALAAPIASCAVTAQRPSLLSHMPTALTSLSMNATWLAITSLLPFTTPSGTSIDLISNYLVNPSSNIYLESTPMVSALPNSTAESRLLDEVTLPEFGQRLAQLLNTFLQGTTLHAASYLRGDLPLPSSPVVAGTPALLSTQLASAPDTLTVPSSSTHTTTMLLFAVSYPWLALYFLATSAMLLAAVASALIRRKSTARDFLPYVSSLCREAQLVKFPLGGADMDGLERTRRCQGVRIQLGDLGDVEGGEEVGTGVAVSVGRLGLGSEGKVGDLVKGKLYL